MMHLPVSEEDMPQDLETAVLGPIATAKSGTAGVAVIK